MSGPVPRSILDQFGGFRNKVSKEGDNALFLEEDINTLCEGAANENSGD